MSKIKFIAKRFAISLFIIALFSSKVKSSTIDASNINTISKDQLKERIESIPSQVDLRYTAEIHSIINSYIKSYRKGSEIILGRVERYFPIYELEFTKQGLPKELKYLSVVESALIPKAISHVGAVGLWQFMKATGRTYGLTINSVVDERKDPMRSTEAASNYLKDLYYEFDDWTLAMAAYNCGPGNVRKALRRSSESKFWEIKRYLPKETRRYIPKYVAISYVMNYFQLHGLKPLISDQETRFATAKIYDYASFKDISNISGESVRKVRELNPAYLKGYIPKSTRGYMLTLPEQEMYNFLVATDGFDNLIYTQKAPRINSKAYLYSSMKNRASQLREIEQIPVHFDFHLSSMSSSSSIPDLPDFPISTDDRNELAFLNPNIRNHKLKAHQSLLDVAELYSTTIEKILDVNNIQSTRDLPPPGTWIKIATE